MANATEQEKYAAKALEVKAKLNAKGHEASFGNKQAPTSGSGSTGDYIEVGTASVFPLKFMADFSSDVRQDDLFYMTSSETDLEACKQMQLNGNDLTIAHVEPFKPDNVTVIYYELQVRG